MAQLTQPVEPFGEVNVHPQKDGSVDIVATILMVPEIEGARTGLALDASISMKNLYGISRVVGGGIFSKAAAGGPPNLVEPVARTMAAYLAQFSATAKCDLVYWACNLPPAQAAGNPDLAGAGVEPIGSVSADEAETVSIAGPKRLPWGGGTKLLPPVKHFVDSAFKDAPWAICVFVTDGVIEDLAAVKAYCLNFGKQIASGQRKFIKLVLIGVGEQVDESQMEELDDMFEGSGLRDPDGNEIDLWDHKLASEMRKIEEIFAEVVSDSTVVAATGKVVNQAGAVAKEYPDGLPALLRFKLPPGSTAFTVEFPGGSVTQDITDGLNRP
ncbi:MAG: VWA domain-containing protein [Isosphaera sp.]|nr:VWA domain-containing protein [Isosphaera sp.]